MKILIGNKRYEHWILTDKSIEICVEPLNIFRKKKYVTYDLMLLDEVKLFYKKDVSVAGSPLGAGVDVVYPVYITFIMRDKEVTINANSGYDNRVLAKALDILTSKGYVVSDPSNLLEGLRDKNIHMWNYIDSIENK